MSSTRTWPECRCLFLPEEGREENPNKTSTWGRGGGEIKKKVFISSSRSEDLKEQLELLFFPPGEEDSWSCSDFAHYTSTAGWLLTEYNTKSNPSCVQ